MSGNSGRAARRQQTILGNIAADVNASESDRLRLQAVKWFAKLNGWHATRATFPWATLAQRDLRLRRWRMPHHAFFEYSAAVDHPLFFKQGGRPVAIVGQPYGRADALVNAAEIVRCYGLEIHRPPAEFASFHFPGACRFLVFTRPGVTIRWLPEQADAFGRFGDHEMRQLFKAFAATGEHDARERARRALRAFEREVLA